jgi:hypothetical protein
VPRLLRPVFGGRFEIFIWQGVYFKWIEITIGKKPSLFQERNCGNLGREINECLSIAFQLLRCAALVAGREPV